MRAVSLGGFTKGHCGELCNGLTGFKYLRRYPFVLARVLADVEPEGINGFCSLESCLLGEGRTCSKLTTMQILKE